MCCLACPSTQWIYPDSKATIDIHSFWAEHPSDILARLQYGKYGSRMDMCPGPGIDGLSPPLIRRSSGPTYAESLSQYMSDHRNHLYRGMIDRLSMHGDLLTGQLGFVIPLGAKPDKCYNEITPNDMYSNLTCAWSGAFILAGSTSSVAWILIRAVSMHLQICWDMLVQTIPVAFC